jgi:hypothetical protein
VPAAGAQDPHSGRTAYVRPGVSADRPTPPGHPGEGDLASFQHDGKRRGRGAVGRALERPSLAVGAGQPEEKALRELLEFASDKGFLFFFADDMSQARPETSYLKDEILLPVVRKFAPRSQVLVMLRPDARTLREGGNHVVQVAQERWPDRPIRAVVLDHTKPPTPARQARPPQNRPGRRVLVLGDTPG